MLEQILEIVALFLVVYYNLHYKTSSTSFAESNILRSVFNSTPDSIKVKFVVIKEDEACSQFKLPK